VLTDSDHSAGGGVLELVVLVVVSLSYLTGLQLADLEYSICSRIFSILAISILILSILPSQLHGGGVIGMIGTCLHGGGGRGGNPLVVVVVRVWVVEVVQV